VLNLTSPQGFNGVYYPFASDECPDNFGVCPDGNSRYVGWPDTGPVVTFSYNGSIGAWAFIDNQHFNTTHNKMVALNNESINLYQVDYQPSSNGAIPVTSLFAESFWSTAEIGYGKATSVVRDGYVSNLFTSKQELHSLRYPHQAYLYGATNAGQLAVTRVSLSGPLGTLGDKSLYEYYVNGSKLEHIHYVLTLKRRV
jgi:hypothetical protein